MSASGDLYRCSTCGASLSLEQLRGTNCPFCNTVFPHHGAAVQHAALVNQVMANQFHQAGYGGPPPQINPQYGGQPPPPFHPYGNVNQQIEKSLATSAKITVFVMLFVVILTLVIGGVVAFLLL
jgi:hypothetical protein